MKIEPLTQFKATMPVMLALLERGEAYKNQVIKTSLSDMVSVNRVLNLLLNHKLINVRKSENKKVKEYYSLTPKGKAIAKYIEAIEALLKS